VVHCPCAVDKDALIRSEREEVPNGEVEALAKAMEQELLAGRTEIIDRAFQADGGPKPLLLFSPQTGLVGDPTLEILHLYWLQLCEKARSQAKDLPLTGSFDPLEITPALPLSMLLDVVDGGADFRYRVYGREIAERFGQDMSGRTITEMPVMAHIGAFFLAVYRVSMQKRCAVLSEHAPPPAVSVTHWRRLIMPLVNGEGSVTRFVVGNIPGTQRWPRPRNAGPGTLAPIAWTSGMRD